MKELDLVLSSPPLSESYSEGAGSVGILEMETARRVGEPGVRRGKRERTPRRHEQAKEAVLDYIRTNRLVSGSRLPTEGDLCQHFGWGRTTVVRALNELAEAGLLNRIQGSGTYVAEARQVRRTLRILVAFEPQAENDDYCAPLLASLLQEAAAHGVDIAYHPHTVPDAGVMAQTKVDGVLAVAWRVDDLRRIIALREAGVNIVGLALRSRSHRLPLVCTDNFDGMHQAVTHLIEQGHRRIAYVCANLGNSDTFERLCGYQVALAKAGVVTDPAHLQVQVSDVGRGVPFLETWWNSMNPKPTAMVIDAPDAPAVLAALSRQRVRIPEDISVVVTDERSALGHHWPPLSFVRQPVQELGRRGLAKLVAMINGEDDGRPEVLPCRLNIRESVRSLSLEEREGDDAANEGAANEGAVNEGAVNEGAVNEGSANEGSANESAATLKYAK